MTSNITSLDLDAELARAGPAAASFARLWESLWRQDHLPAELLELCRLTLARLHQDELEIAIANPLAGSSDRGRRSVLDDRVAKDPALSDGEKAVLLFAEYYWLDAQSIPDETADQVKAHYGEPGLVLLIEALGCLDGRIRTARCLRDLSAHRATKEMAHVG